MINTAEPALDQRLLEDLQGIVATSENISRVYLVNVLAQIHGAEAAHAHVNYCFAVGSLRSRGGRVCLCVELWLETGLGL